MLGVLPPAACALLPNLVPNGLAAHIVFTGEPVTAAEAHAAGIVLKVVPDDSIEEEASAIAGNISRHSAAALRVTKRALRVGVADAMAAALAEENKIYVNDLMNTADAVEGLKAFLEKRKSVWKHE